MRPSPLTAKAVATDPEVMWGLEHARQVAEEEADAWFLVSATRRREVGDDIRLARIIQRLAREAPCRQRGTLPPPDRACLLADSPLAAYWLSVAAAGDEGWKEERRVLSLTSAGVSALLDEWRAWGQLLIAEGEAVDIEGAFRMAG